MSQVPNLKKERLPNFTVKEDQRLLDLIYDNRAAIVYDSMSNKTTNELKQKVSYLDNYCLK